MEVLVIGGSRFVGPYIISKLLKKGHSVTVFNRGIIQSKYLKKVTFIKGNRDKSFSINKHFDVVIDTCAYKGEQTDRLIKELKFNFLVHFSTIAAYKKTEIIPLTERSQIGLWPMWGDYNKGKVECEQVLRKSRIKYAIIRPTYILGPNNYCDRENFIYSRIKKGEPLVLPGNGQCVAHFVFANDVAESIIALAEKKVQGAFNCCGDELITIKGIVEEMGKIIGKKPIIKFNPKTDGVGWNDNEFPFANENLIGTNDKLKKLRVKFTPLVKGLKQDYEEYYKKHI